ncbi:MAG: AAA family ATPase [Phycisphaeraceae bacterium]|nr:AAA family ATPase [Phycisphaeraceae bacterium]
MSRHPPQIIVIGGPNGAGKSTIAREVLHGTLGVSEFVNADTIASGLSGFDPERAAFAAGRVMLARLRELAAAGQSFAFESTLASRSLAPWLQEIGAGGYVVLLLYVWLRSPEIAVRRVQARVRRGGHSVPDEVIHRRFGRSAANLIDLYLPIAERFGAWRVYDNSTRAPRQVAMGGRGMRRTIYHPVAWQRLQEAARGNE